MDEFTMRERALSQAAHDCKGQREADIVVRRAEIYLAFLRGGEDRDKATAQLAESLSYPDELLVALPYNSAATIRRLAREFGNAPLISQLDRLQVAVDA
jgi:hypothetical protein